MDCSCPIANEVWNYSGWSSVASCTSLSCYRFRSYAAVGGLFTGSWVTTSGSKTSSLAGSIFAEWRLPEIGPFTIYVAVAGTICSLPSAAFCLGEEQMGAQQINNSRTLCYSFQPHANPDLRSTEPTQITPFLGNFPDPTLSLPTRTGNALILGLADSWNGSCVRVYAIARVSPSLTPMRPARSNR